MRSGTLEHQGRAQLTLFQRLDANINDECPPCSGVPHDTNHLFNGLANPTSLTPLDLWTSPTKVASFLELKTERECGEEQ
ncbi:hypothetical protein M8J77_002529 [Diaphorina citri]|nr:hypothetical protein M8J77_002529 [Diaphorina citri]